MSFHLHLYLEFQFSLRCQLYFLLAFSPVTFTLHEQRPTKVIHSFIRSGSRQFLHFFTLRPITLPALGWGRRTKPSIVLNMHLTEILSLVLRLSTSCLTWLKVWSAWRSTPPAWLLWLSFHIAIILHYKNYLTCFFYCGLYFSEFLFLHFSTTTPPTHKRLRLKEPAYPLVQDFKSRSDKDWLVMFYLHTAKCGTF